jgi:hypothetical protein
LFLLDICRHPLPRAAPHPLPRAAINRNLQAPGPFAGVHVLHRILGAACISPDIYKCGLLACCSALHRAPPVSCLILCGSSFVA